MIEVELILRGDVSNSELNALFRDSFPEHEDRDFHRTLSRSDAYVVARRGSELVGFAKIIGDDDLHAFLLDPIVRTDLRRRGIGRQLIAICEQEAAALGYTYLHVDFEPQNEAFYAAIGFRGSLAGIKALAASWV